MKRLPKSFGSPVELSLELLGGKWKPAILARLKDGPLRYRDLRQQIPRLSDKVLSERLAELCEQGLVLRKNGGRESSYRLSSRGKSLEPVLQSLYEWGQVQAPDLKVIFR